jgi:ATP synthase protein I
MNMERKPHKEHLPGIVAKKCRRKERAGQAKKRPIFFGFGMFGMVGWTVALPAVLGTLLGRWLDGRHLLDGRISWTLTGLGAGLFAGIIAAWRWVNKHSGGDDAP